jgi:hypothetical protein
VIDDHVELGRSVAGDVADRDRASARRGEQTVGADEVWDSRLLVTQAEPVAARVESLVDVDARVADVLGIRHLASEIRRHGHDVRQRVAVHVRDLRLARVDEIEQALRARVIRVGCVLRRAIDEDAALVHQQEPASHPRLAGGELRHHDEVGPPVEVEIAEREVLLVRIAGHQRRDRAVGVVQPRAGLVGERRPLVVELGCGDPRKEDRGQSRTRAHRDRTHGMPR